MILLPSIYTIYLYQSRYNKSIRKNVKGEIKWLDLS
nr:MAG TPA: hypothetical protein [Caudoviricetes sp.]